MTNSELELAKDQLWKFQLRREHAQLLKDLNMQKAAFAVFSQETKANQDSLVEQLTSLKSKFEKLAGDNERQAHESKAQQRALEEQIVEISKIKNDLIALGVHSRVLERGEKAIEDPTISIIPLEGTEAPAPAAPAKSSSATFTHPLPIESSALPATTTTTTTTTAIATPTPTTTTTPDAPNTANRKSRRQARQPPSPQKPPAYTKLPSPPLNQEDRSLADYFSTMDKLSARLDPALSTGLAAMFVTGLAQREHQDMVVARLEERGLAVRRTSWVGDDDGEGQQQRRQQQQQVEMRCKWGDLKPVLRKVGLLETVSHKKKVR